MASYEAACQNNDGGAFLRREGLFSSQMTDWRRLRDGGVLAGKKPGETIGKLSADQGEIARLRRQLEVSESRLKRSEAALGIMEIGYPCNCRDYAVCGVRQGRSSGVPVSVCGSACGVRGGTGTSFGLRWMTARLV